MTTVGTPSIALLLGLMMAVRCAANLQQVTGKEYSSMPPLFHLDDYDNCMLYGPEALYCRITFTLRPSDPANASSVWSTIRRVSASPRNYRHDLLRHGVCVPTSCPDVAWASRDDPNIATGLGECYNRKYGPKGLQGAVTRIHCETTDPPYPIDSLDVAVAAVFLCYAALVVFASVYEGAARYRPRDQYDRITGTPFGKIVAAFSIPRNWQRLKHINNDDPDVRRLRCIQGIRFYNMICVILAHTVMISLAVPVANPIYVETMTQNPMHMFLANGGYVVQTFFLISGWLMTYQFFVAFDGKRQPTAKHLALAFANRYFRLTPLLAAVVAFNSTWIVHIGRGPVWEQTVGMEYRKCRLNGWTNLVYLNNFIDSKNMCTPQTWYTGNDTLFFAIGLVVLYFGLHSPRRFWAMLAALWAVHGAFLASTTYWHRFEPVPPSDPEWLAEVRLMEQTQWLMMFQAPWGNLCGLIAGMAFGYLFYRTRNKRMLFFQSTLNVWLFFVAVWVGAVGIIVVQGIVIYAPDYEYNVAFAVFFGTVGRSFFVFWIGAATFAVTQNVGGPFQWTLEWPPTYVLGRLTYSAYLVHTTLMRIGVGQSRAPRYVTDGLLASQTIQDVACSYIVGLVLTLCIELPVSALQGMLVARANGQQRHTVKDEKRRKQ